MCGYTTKVAFLEGNNKYGTIINKSLKLDWFWSLGRPFF